MGRNFMKIKEKDYIKCSGVAVEMINGKARIAFARCPKCHNWISLYKEELNNEGKTRYSKRCSCGFKDMLYLENFDDNEEFD